MFYNNFVYLCNKSGKSPSAAAEEMGYQRSVVTRWSKGTAPRQATLQKVADYFGVSVSDLVSEQKEKSPAPEGAELSKERIQLLLEQMSAAELVELMGDITDTLKRRGSPNL